MARIHSTKGRMPAFLISETAKVWLDQDLSWQERIEEALNPVADEFLDDWLI